MDWILPQYVFPIAMNFRPIMVKLVQVEFFEMGFYLITHPAKFTADKRCCAGCFGGVVKSDVKLQYKIKHPSQQDDE